MMPEVSSPSDPNLNEVQESSLPNSPHPFESITSFLTRLPPSTTTLSSTGHPWIHIHPPNTPAQPTQRIGTFKQLTLPLLSDFSAHRSYIESCNPNTPAFVITKMLKSAREKLESDILRIGKECNVTTGKWMLFPSVTDVDAVWAKVATGTAEGRLGCSAKVAVDDEGEDGKARRERLICVYTNDFSDLEDVKRVMGEMRDLGLVKDEGGGGGGWGRGSAGGGRGRGGGNGSGGGRGIYYKCDAYTHLDLMSGNEYGIKASMYNSRDIGKGSRTENS